MKSMTGYGRSAFVGDDFSVAVDLKTVNNRFLDIHVRLGTEIASMEALVKRRISARLARGRVDLNITFDRTSQLHYELNRPLIAGYVNALREIQKEFDLTGEPDINTIARMPGALQTAREGLTETMMAG